MWRKAKARDKSSSWEKVWGPRTKTEIVISNFEQGERGRTQGQIPRVSPDKAERMQCKREMQAEANTKCENRVNLLNRLVDENGRSVCRTSVDARYLPFLPPFCEDTRHSCLEKRARRNEGCGGAVGKWAVDKQEGNRLARFEGPVVSGGRDVPRLEFNLAWRRWQTWRQRLRGRDVFSFSCSRALNTLSEHWKKGKRRENIAGTHRCSDRIARRSVPGASLCSSCSFCGCDILLFLPSLLLFCSVP